MANTVERSIDNACKATDLYPNRDREEQLTDILTDLMHWANAYGVEFGVCYDRAVGHYCYEIMEES